MDSPAASKTFATQESVTPDGGLTLAQLAGGEARVVGVSGDAADAARLMAMGICVGRRVEIIRQGDPLIVRVVGARVGLSARLAAHVRVVAADQAIDSVNAA
jgi:Fe2+ transport system protein FeoA